MVSTKMSAKHVSITQNGGLWLGASRCPLEPDRFRSLSVTKKDGQEGKYILGTTPLSTKDSVIACAVSL